MSFALDASGALNAADQMDAVSERIKGVVDNIQSSFEKLSGRFGNISGKFNDLVGGFLGLEGGLFKLVNPLSLLKGSFVSLGLKMVKLLTGSDRFKTSLDTLKSSFETFLNQILTAITKLPIVSKVLGLIKDGITFVTDKINNLSKALTSGLAFDLLIIEAKSWIDTFSQGIDNLLSLFSTNTKQMGDSAKSFWDMYLSYAEMVWGGVGKLFDFLKDAILNLPINLKTAFAIMIVEGDKLWMSFAKSFDLLMIDLKVGWENLGFAVGNIGRTIELVFAKVIDGIINGLASAITTIGEQVSKVPGFGDMGQDILNAAEGLKGFANNTENVKAAMQAANAEHQNTLSALQQEKTQVEENFTRQTDFANQYAAELLAKRDQALADKQMLRDAAFAEERPALPGPDQLPVTTNAEQAVTELSPEQQAMQGESELTAEQKELQQEEQTNYFTKEQEQLMAHFNAKEALLQGHLNKFANIQQKSMKTMETFNKMSVNQQIGTVLGGMTKMASGSKSASKKMFEVNKAFALANAAVSLPDAVLQSFRNGGGYPWGLIPAGIMSAQGIKQIKAIKSSKFGGGGGAPTVSGGGGGNVPVGPTAIASTSAASSTSEALEGEVVQDGASSQAAARGSVSINVSGVITQDIVDELMIPAIQEAVENRDVVLIRNGTRNADELGGS